MRGPLSSPGCCLNHKAPKRDPECSTFISTSRKENAQISFHTLKTAGGEQLTCKNRLNRKLKVKETNPDRQEQAVLA